MTKLAQILNRRNLTHRDLQKRIHKKFGIIYSDDRISRLVNGKISNYSIQTAKILSQTLGVRIDRIID